jgi:hypothetical protein
MVIRERVFWAVAVLAAVGCKPDIAGRPSLVEEDRVLAVRSLPAEAKAGAAVRYDALYVGKDGDADATTLAFAYCSERKPIAVSGPIALECLASAGPGLTAIGDGTAVDTSLPADVCSAFGPSPPQPKPGEPPQRPTDPDTTGGYYQIVRVLAKDSTETPYSVGVTRLDCGLANASQEESLAYSRQYRPNENPALASLQLTRTGSAPSTIDPDGDPVRVAPRERVTFRVSWPECPGTSECGDGICGPGEAVADCPEDCTTPVGCRGSEPYSALDPATRRLAPRREAIRVSWFSGAGTFEHDRTGRTEADADTANTDNDWTAPEEPGTAFVWIVIRDDRGGVGWSRYRFDVSR